LLAILPVEGTPVMRTWNVVTLQSKQLSPAAEAFRDYIVGHGEAHLEANDAPLLAPLLGKVRVKKKNHSVPRPL
jgi:hypothetical protein